MKYWADVTTSLTCKTSYFGVAFPRGFNVTTVNNNRKVDGTTAGYLLVLMLRGHDKGCSIVIIDWCGKSLLIYRDST